MIAWLNQNAPKEKRLGLLDKFRCLEDFMITMITQPVYEPSLRQEMAPGVIELSSLCIKQHFQVGTKDRPYSNVVNA